jgi:hypothetical protein
MRPVWMYLSSGEMAANDTRLLDVSRFVAGLTASQVARPDTIRPGHADDEVFDAVFAGSILPNLSCG